MIQPATLSQMLASNPIATTQAAIAETVRSLMPGVAIVLHPGRVDLSELVAKSIVAAPGVGVGWSQARYAGMADGSFCIVVSWVAYIVAEAIVMANRRVEKEAVGLAIGNRLLKILADDEAPFWGLNGVLPVEDKPAPDLKPFFTIRDASQGTAYYVVTWSQVIADIGETAFPTALGKVLSEDEPVISYDSAEDLADVARFFPARKVDDNA